LLIDDAKDYAHFAVKAAEVAISACTWEDQRPQNLLNELRDVFDCAPASCHPFEDPLGASRLSFEWGWDGTDQLTDSSYHALRSLHYAFAVVEEFLFLRALAPMDTLLDRDLRPVKVDNCRAVKHANTGLG